MPTYKTVSFFNYTDEDFTHKYGGEPYTIASGEADQYPEFLAKHLAEHLAMRELNRRRKSGNKVPKLPLQDREIKQEMRRALEAPPKKKVAKKEKPPKEESKGEVTEEFEGADKLPKGGEKA